MFSVSVVSSTVQTSGKYHFFEKQAEMSMCLLWLLMATTVNLEFGAAAVICREVCGIEYSPNEIRSDFATSESARRCGLRSLKSSESRIVRRLAVSSHRRLR